MSRFREEFSIISSAGKVIAFLVWLALLVGMTFMLSLGKPHPPLFSLVFAALVAPTVLAVYVLVVAYIHTDAKRRGMQHVMWTLLALFIPNAIGIILYFILREPILRRCTTCRLSVKPGLAFCPGCGAPLGPVCPACRRAVEPQSSFCPHCGGRLAV